MHGNPFYFTLTVKISLQLDVRSKDSLSTLDEVLPFNYRKRILLHTAPNQNLESFHKTYTINNDTEGYDSGNVFKEKKSV